MPEFAQKLAALAEVYVDDAFGSAHRAHASTEGITHYLSPCAAGLLMEKELEYLGKAVENPARPYVAIVGGAKVSDKIELLQNFLKIADTVLVGGAMAYTFLKAQGVETGKSKTEDDKLDLAKTLLADAASRGKKFLLPKDHIVADKFDASAVAETAADPRHSCGPHRAGYRSGNARRIRGGNRQGQNHRVEWSDGRVRNGTIRRGHARHRQGGGGIVGRVDCGWRRFRGGSKEDGSGR